MSALLYGCFAMCNPRKVLQATPILWEKPRKITGTMEAILGLAVVIFAASLRSYLWLFLTAGLLFLLNSVTTLLAAFKHTKPTILIVDAVFGSITTAVVFILCIIWLSISNQITDDDCDRMGLTSGPCSTHHTIGTVCCVILLLIDLLFVLLANITAWLFWRSVLAQAAYLQSHSTNESLAPESGVPHTDSSDSEVKNT